MNIILKSKNVEIKQSNVEKEQRKNVDHSDNTLNCKKKSNSTDVKVEKPVCLLIFLFAHCTNSM